MGLFNWLMKGIGFEGEDEIDEQSLALAEQKRLYKENKRQERLNNKLRKQEAKNMVFQKYEEEPEEEPLPSAVLYEEYKPRTVPTETVFMQPDSSQNGYGYDGMSQQQVYGGYDTPSYAQTTMAGYGNKNVVFFYPKKYSEVQNIIDFLRQGESVMLNLDSITDEEAQRMLDFASGAVYALSGNIQRVQGNIFLLTPEGLRIINPAQNNNTQE